MTGGEFKAIRKKLDLTQAELANMLGYSTAVRISEFERATNPVPVPRLVALLMMAMNETEWRPPIE